VRPALPPQPRQGHRQGHRNGPQALGSRRAQPEDPVLPPLLERPELPGHLQDHGYFLSPIVCRVDATHRFRDTAFTLRVVESEACVKCLMPTLSLAGD
jgi:hypothetical protein